MIPTFSNHFIFIMHGLLLLIGIITSALANPIPGAQSSDLEYSDLFSPPREVSADKDTFENRLLAFSANNEDNNGIALGNVGDDPLFDSSYGATDSFADETSLEDVNENEVVAQLGNWWMSPSDREYTDAQCGGAKSICCPRNVIGPFTQSVSCQSSAQPMTLIFLLW